MAVIALPTIREIISGDGVTALDQSSSFTLTEKLEAVRYIKASDGKVTIDYSYIDVLKTIMFTSSDVCTVEITTTSTDVVPVVTVMPLEINGTFRLDLTPAFRGLISSIKILTSITTDITVNIRAYGIAA